MVAKAAGSSAEHGSKEQQQQQQHTRVSSEKDAVQLFAAFPPRSTFTTHTE
jgi:hypothetical protein